MREQKGAQRGQRTGQGNKAEDLLHHNQRPQIAAPEPNQRAEAAIARQGHAGAERQAANDRGQGVPRTELVNRSRQINHTGKRPDLGAQIGSPTRCS